MLQLSLCVNGISKRAQEEFKLNVRNYVVNKLGVFSVYEKDDFLYYLIVINGEENVDIANQNYIKKQIAQCIINSFKYDLIVSNLRYDFVRDYKYYTLIEALLNFDYACDEMYIMDKLDFSSGEIYLQSFYYFCLKILKEKWMQLINITNQNSKTLNEQENYVEVLRFLLDGIDKNEVINVEEISNKIKVKKQKEVVFFSSYKELISYIIRNNPKIIKLKNVDKSFVNFIKQLFLTRVTVNN